MIKIKRILAPVDFSSYTAQSLEYAFELADQFDGEVHLLHVLHNLLRESPSFGMGLASPILIKQDQHHQHQLEASAREQLEALLESRRNQTQKVETAIRWGHPFDQITRYAEQHEIDLIIIGSHGRSGLNHALLGSVAEKVIRKSPCPVLTIRAEGHQFKMP